MALRFPWWLMAAVAMSGCAADAADEEVDETEDALSEAVRSPSSMHGVKIKHPGGDNDVRNTCRYTTGPAGSSYYGAISKLHRKGVYDLFIKFPQPQQVPAYCTKERLEDEIVDMLGQITKFNKQRPASTPPLRAWVWERTWLWKDDGGLRADSYATYINDMSGVIKHAKKSGVAGALEGIGVIETNLKGTDQVRELSVKTAHDINAKTNGWLKTHTFLFPGAGMGSWFKNIDQGMPAFYAAMDREVKYFAFIYKFMPSQESDPAQVNATLEPYYYGPKADWSVETKKPMAEQRAYVEDTLGFKDLRNMIEWGRKNGHKSLANVVFWGDSADGVTKMKPGSVQLMHRLLVEEMNERGHFFDFAVMGGSQEDAKTRSKHVLIDSKNGVERNDVPAWNDGSSKPKYATALTAWDEWSSWPASTPVY